MDAIGCGEMLDEVVEFFDGGALDALLMDVMRDNVTPKLSGLVLDGDASTNSLIPVCLKKAAELRQAGASSYCSDLKVLKWTNHLAMVKRSHRQMRMCRKKVLDAVLHLSIVPQGSAPGSS